MGFFLVYRFILSIVIVLITTATIVYIITRKNYYLELNIAHINNYYSSYPPVSRTDGSLCNQTKEEGCIGGYNRLTTMINEMKKKKNYVVVNAGNFFTNSVYFSIFKSEIAYTLLNELPFDAHFFGHEMKMDGSCILKHDLGLRSCKRHTGQLLTEGLKVKREYEFGRASDEVIPYIKYLHAPTLICNIDSVSEPEEMKHIYLKSHIIERGGLKIGLIGVVSKYTDAVTVQGELMFRNEIISINREIKKLLKVANVFTVIVLSQCGYENDKTMALGIGPKVSLIIGSNSGGIIYNGTPPLIFNGSKVLGTYPTVIHQENGDRVLIISAYERGVYIGNLSVFYNRRGKVKSWEGNPIFLDSSIEEDEYAREKFSVFKSTIEEEGKNIIGMTSIPLLRSDCKKGECPLGNFITDGMLDIFNSFKKSKIKKFASIAIVHPQFFKKDLPKGDISIYDYFAFLTSNTEICCVVTKAKHIKSAIRHAATSEKGSTYMLQVSGMKVTLDYSRDEKDRVTDLELMCYECEEPVYEKYEEEKTYRIVMTTELARGALGFQMFVYDREDLIHGPSIREPLKEYIMKKGDIAIPVEGRITIK